LIDEVQRQKIIQQNIQGEIPVLKDLAQVGYHLGSISDLRSGKYKYQVAIPVLMHWLPIVQNRDIKEEIVRALSVPWAKPVAALPLINEFKQADPDELELKWAIGNALSVVADDSVFSEIVELVQDRQHGQAREMLAVALGNMSTAEAVDVLIELLDNNDLVGHALMGLSKLKAEKARIKIDPFLNHPKAWVRSTAKKALYRIDKKVSKTVKK
jgi:hypothetical protein